MLISSLKFKHYHSNEQCYVYEQVLVDNLNYLILVPIWVLVHLMVIYYVPQQLWIENRNVFLIK